MPQRTSAYISQYDLHIGEMTVRETLAFSARCQGVGPRYGQWKNSTILSINGRIIRRNPGLNPPVSGCFADMLAELSRREKEANIKPDPDVDIYMKVSN